MIRFLWVCLLLLCQPLSASELRIDDDFLSINLTKPIDTALYNGEKTPLEVFETETFTTELFQASISPNTDSYWYRITVNAVNLTTHKKLYLLSQSHLLQHLDFYLVRAGQVIKTDSLGISDRPYSDELYQGVIFSFTLAPEESITILIRKKNDGPGIMPLSMMSENALQDHLIRITLFWGCIIGVFLALAVYNSVVFSLNRKSAQYGWYLMFQAFMFLNFAPLHGFGYLILPDSFVRFLGVHMGTLHLILLWCALMFAEHFLDISKYKPRLGGTIKKSIWFFLPLFVANLHMTEMQRMYMTSVLIIGVSYICISSAIYAIRQRYYPAKYYLLSWVCTWIGACTGFLTYSNLIPQNLFTMHSFMLGVVAELYMLSVGLAKRLQYHEELDEQHRLIDQTLNMPNQSFYQYALEKQFKNREIDLSKVRLILINLEGLDHLISVLGTDKVTTEIRKIMSDISTEVSNLPWQINLSLNKDYFAISIPPMQTMVLATTEEPADQQIKTLLAIWNQILSKNFYFSDIFVRAACADNSGKVTDLHQKAYMALLEAQKQEVKWLQFDNQMNEKVEAQIHILHELRLAISNANIDIFVQPKVNIASKKVIGGEALMRWNHSELGMVPPNVFIPLAEQSGLIHKLTRLAIEKMFVWIATTPSDFSLSINISALDLMQDDFIDFLDHALNLHKIAPSRITLEITESQELDHSQELIRKVSAIKKLGFAISLDDFGTGYSSMAYLSQLEVDEVKIDKIFIKDIQNNITNKTIVKTLLNMAETLGADVVIEGIETREELKVVYQLGGIIGQGFFWSPAIAVEQFQQQYFQMSVTDNPD